MPKVTAADYDRMVPGVDIPDAQKQERAERKVFKAERADHSRTGRNRGIVVPELPWLRDQEEEHE